MAHLTAALLLGMRGTNILSRTSGLWQVRKRILPAFPPAWRVQTSLHKLTEATLHLEEEGGDCVMEDSLPELEKHLQFVLRASGRVLVTGLGLGCVVRGLLANQDVTSITVIEREAAVLKLAQASVADPRVTIIHADALSWIERTTTTYDWAWHDLWSDPDREEEQLQCTHAQLIAALYERVPHQGAWEFPRMLRRTLDRVGGGLLSRPKSTPQTTAPMRNL